MNCKALPPAIPTDFDRPDPVFWRQFEQRVLDLQRLGIQADIILWHPYDRWGFSEMSDDQDDHYLRYCIARLSAFRNVWWSLANEYDFMTNVPKGHRGNKQWEDWDRFFFLQREDPHQRLRGIHNDSIASGDNVSWYFTKPIDRPRKVEVILDRRTTYHGGAVDSEVGPLAIGNFNETMHGYGLDRQFRGEISRAVQIFGSRVSGRGALNADAIKERLLLLSSASGVKPDGNER